MGANLERKVRRHGYCASTENARQEDIAISHIEETVCIYPFTQTVESIFDSEIFEDEHERI